MSEYREIAPPPRLARTVECFWAMQHSGPELPHRVLPDGCADILFTRDRGAASIEAVGPMTRYQDFPLTPGSLLIGVRFHPGMWTTRLGVPADLITDEILPLDRLWGGRALDLRDRLAEARSVDQSIRVLEQSLPPAEAAGPFQRALAFMAERHGCVSLDDMADQSGLSARQFRRVCLAETGLTPKFLARVLRFRQALSRVHQHPCAFAHLALDCGYYDQAHFINEFRALSGRTPTAATNVSAERSMDT
jgi:AraC-like DNA-binding protein